MNKGTKGNNLNKYISGTAKNWKEQAKNYTDNRKEIRRAQKFALELLDYMDEHDIKQIDLAKKMGVSPQQVNKILRAKANLTFETLDKIADALGVEITTPKIKRIRIPNSPVIKNNMRVAYKRHRTIEESLTSTVVVSKNPILEKTLEAMNEYLPTAEQI